MKQKIVNFKPDRGTVEAAVLGAAAILASAAMNLIPGLRLQILLRDFLQIGIIGLLLPALILRRDETAGEAGIRFRYAWLLIPLSFLLAAFTFYQITGDLSMIKLLFTAGMAGPAVYVMAANVFEVLFYFVYIRYYMEKAFGIIPAILIAAAFYSFHHAGFQPEFLKLFIVGAVYISIFRIANSWLICFPLWFAGGLGDVFFNSEVVQADSLSAWRSIIPVIFIITALVIALRRRPERDL